MESPHDVGMGGVRALVVGGGVSGLSTALALVARGARVRVVSRDDPLRTTSTVAGAIWHPFRVYPEARVNAWALETYRELRRISEESPEAGVVMREGVEYLRSAADAPSWGPGVDGYELLGAGELRAPYAAGHRMRVPIVETPIYMRWLVGRLERAGVSVERRALSSLDELRGEADVVVDCAGLGARELAGDAEMRAVWGQVLRVRQPRDRVETFTLDDADPAVVTYVIPRSEDVILGGAAEAGREDLGADAGISRGILERCGELEPRVRGAEVLEVKVGLRPGRPSVRLEAERRGWGVVVHNYGHGGAGVTVSCGCAREAAGLALDALANA